MCVKLSLAEFDDDMDSVCILNEFLISSGLDGGHKRELKPTSSARPLSGQSGPRWLT